MNVLNMDCIEGMRLFPDNHFDSIVTDPPYELTSARPGGLVLDPFTGSGSTGKAATLEGFAFLGFELSAEYTAIAQARIDAAVITRHTAHP